MARKKDDKKKDKDKKKKKKKKEEDEDDDDDDDDDEWVVDTTLDDVLANEAKNLENELKEQGKGLAKEKRKTAAEKKREKDALTKAEIKVRQAEQASKSNMFAVDGKIKDKRDMIGKGGGEDTLFDFEVGGSVCFHSIIGSVLSVFGSLARPRATAARGVPGSSVRARASATIASSSGARGVGGRCGLSSNRSPARRDPPLFFCREASGTSSSEYKREGNVEFYTQTNLHKRRAIFCDKVVQKWFDVFFRTFSSVARTGHVAQTEFMTVQINIAKARLLSRRSSLVSSRLSSLVSRLSSHVSARLLAMGRARGRRGRRSITPRGGRVVIACPQTAKQA